MAEFAITLDRPNIEDCCCVCHGPLTESDGPKLCRAACHSPVCRSCGRKHAPQLAALVDMAEVAGRVGQIGRHTVMPSLNSLLELARVAENYADSHTTRRSNQFGHRAVVRRGFAKVV